MDMLNSGNKEIITINKEKVEIRDIMSVSKGTMLGSFSVPPDMNIVETCWKKFNNQESWAELCIDNPSFMYPLDMEDATGETIQYREQ